MNNYVMPVRHYHPYVICCISYLLLNLLSPLHTIAQESRSVPGEAATCTVKRGSMTTAKGKAVASGKVPTKTYVLKMNQLGSFDQVSNILPNETVPVEVAYPNGKAGEKVLLSAEDGGKFSNGKRVMVAQLDNQKKLVFNFQVNQYAGIYHVSLRKGNDTKVVKLWVGQEIAAAPKK